MNVIAFSKFDFLAGNVKRLLFHNEICLITLNRFTKRTFVTISSTNVNSVASDFSKNAITNRICFHMKPPMAQSNIFFHRLPSSDSAKVNTTRHQISAIIHIRIALYGTPSTFWQKNTEIT